MNHHTPTHRRLLLPFFTLLFLAACDMNTETVQQTQLISDKENVIRLHSEIDTIIMEGDTLTFTPDNPLNKKEKVWSTRFIDDSTKQKVDSGYIFRLQNGEEIALTNNTEDVGDSYKKYEEFSDIPAINHWLFEVSHYEWTTYELIDKADGTVTEIIDYPVLSPHRDKIIVCKEDLDSGLEFNGIEYLKVKNNKVEPVWIRELTQVSLTNPKWVDNNTVIFKRVNASTHKFDFVKVVLK